MLTKYLTNTICIIELAIQTTRYAIFFPIPCPSQENLPPTSRASRAADTQTQKVCLHFSGLSWFCARDRKTTGIDWLIFFH